jgi:hypothetical protein
MILKLINNTATPKTYDSGLVTLPASSSVVVPIANQLGTAVDGNLFFDITNNNTSVSDSVNTFVGNDALTYLNRLIAVQVNINDSSGNALTSTLVGSKQSLDVNISQSSNNADNIGSGNITALNVAVTANTQGCSSIQFVVSGTWSATLTIQGTVDGVNWNVTQGDVDSTDTITSTLIANGLVTIPCGAFSQVRLIATAYTSGTAVINYDASAGVSLVEVYSTNYSSLLNTSKLTDGVNGIVGVTPGSGGVNSLNMFSIDSNGTGTLGILNATVVITTQGYSSVGIVVTGTWVGNIIFEGSVDGNTWVTTLGVVPNESGTFDVIVGAISDNETVILNCGGYKQLRTRMNLYTSGTANIAYETGIGANYSHVFSSVAKAFNAQVQGNIGSQQGDSGNPVKVGGVYNTSLITLTTGERGDLQLDSSGRTIISPLLNTSVVKAQLQDNAGNALASINSQLETRDVINISSQYRAQSITTTASEALGASTILVNRKLLHVTPTNGTIYWGYSNAVTTATGSPIFPNNTLWLSVTDNLHVWLIAGATTDSRIGELS